MIDDPAGRRTTINFTARSGRANSSAQAASIYEATLQRAINLLQESLSLWREASNHYGEAYSLNLMGMVFT